MKRWVIIITICILIGAIINVAIAWWFAIRFDRFAPYSNSKIGISNFDYGYGQWSVSTHYWLGSTRTSTAVDSIEGSSRNNFPVEKALPYWAESIRPEQYQIGMLSNKSLKAIAQGWPFRAMMIIAGPGFDSEDKLLRGIPWDAPTWLRGRPIAPPSQVGPIYLPLKIIWPGFIANTLLYSLVFYSIFFMHFKLRHVLRLKRKQCIKCGYPIGQSEICTECGEELKASA